MRTIRIIEHISLDGVIQAPGNPNEDGDYPYGGWAAPFQDPAAGQAIVAAQGEQFDLLLVAEPTISSPPIGHARADRWQTT
jgi:hypothetical protein